MAIYHCSAKIISRSTGRSSVAAAAYRSGEKLHNDYDGMTHDYTKKQGVVYSEIMLCNNAPTEYQNRETLWNEVEKIEKGNRAQLSREIEIALPTELNREEQIKLVQDYTRENFVKSGMCADFSIHDKGDGNPHAHIMLTMRSINENGQWESKSKKVYQYDKQGNKIYDPKKRQYKCTKENTTDWNDKSKLEEWRKNWADICNREFENKNLPERIDHQTLEAQGIEREPTVHMGTAAHQMEQRGIETDKGTINREARAANMEYKQGLKELEKEMRQLRESINQLQPQQPKEIEPEEIKHGKRFDEEETRNWQRGDGLMREDTASAKYSALVQDSKKQDTPESNSIEQSEVAQISTGTTAEQTAERLNALRADYIRLEMQIQQTQQKTGELQGKQRQLQSRAESIQEKSQTIDQYSQRIEQLKVDRAQLGLFAGKDKKAIDEQVKRLEQSKEQAKNSLKRECGNAAPGAALEQLQQQQAANRTQLAALPDTSKLKEQQTAIEQTYKRERSVAMQRPDKDQIRELSDRGEQRPQYKSMNERMAAAKAESKLQEKDTVGTHQHTKGIDRGRR